MESGGGEDVARNEQELLVRDGVGSFEAGDGAVFRDVGVEFGEVDAVFVLEAADGVVDGDDPDALACQGGGGDAAGISLTLHTGG